jgi:hypothetical protein
MVEGIRRSKRGMSMHVLWLEGQAHAKRRHSERLARPP